MADGRGVVPLSDAAWRQRTLLLIALALTVVLVMAFIKPIAQPPEYHDFKDARAFIGIPNFLNVVSNLPFLIVGALGVRWTLSRPANLGSELVMPYIVVFAGLAATALGSAWYHWWPDSGTLVWDRLPIAVSFMALYVAVLAERVSPKAATMLLWPLAVYGAATVLYWHVYDDLRPYLIAQFLPVLTMPLILWAYPARYSLGHDFLTGVGFYAAAKLFEEMDGPMYRALLGMVSGHTLKHLAAAGGAYWIYRMLKRRTRLRS